jgi:hypothetical protein
MHVLDVRPQTGLLLKNEKVGPARPLMLVNYFIDFFCYYFVIYCFHFTRWIISIMYLVMHFWNDFDDFLPDFTNEHIIYII